MIQLQPHFGDTRRQKLRSSPFCHTPLFRSQSVKEGESSSLKNAPLKTLRVLDLNKTSSFVVPTTIRKEAPTGNALIGVNSLQTVTNHFPQVGVKRVTEAPEVVSNHTQWEEGVETPPNDSPSLSPPFFLHKRPPSFLIEETGKQKNAQIKC